MIIKLHATHPCSVLCMLLLSKGVSELASELASCLTCCFLCMAGLAAVLHACGASLPALSCKLQASNQPLLNMPRKQRSVPANFMFVCYLFSKAKRRAQHSTLLSAHTAQQLDMHCLQIAEKVYHALRMLRMHLTSCIAQIWASVLAALLLLASSICVASLPAHGRQLRLASCQRLAAQAIISTDCRLHGVAAVRRWLPFLRSMKLHSCRTSARSKHCLDESSAPS